MTDRLEVVETSFGPNTEIPAHVHLRPTVCVVLDGGYDERYRSVTVECTPGTALFHAPGEEHADRFGPDGGRCLTVTVDGSLLDDEDAGGFSPVGVRSRIVPPRSVVYTILRELHRDDGLTPIVVRDLAVELFSGVGDAPALELAGAPPRWLRAVREWVHREFRRPPSLTELAADAGVHRSHVARAFRRHYGCTVGEYARLRRISVAVQAVRSSSRSLGQIAHATGFSDQSHLTRSVRAVMGMTPGELRRRFPTVM